MLLVEKRYEADTITIGDGGYEPLAFSLWLFHLTWEFWV